jgi:hypothetical protein
LNCGNCDHGEAARFEDDEHEYPRMNRDDANASLKQIIISVAIPF